MSVFRVGSNKSSVNNFPSVRPTLDLDFANSKTLDPRITFTRASGGSYVGADGLIKLAGVNGARFDHNPVTGESLGFLIEESRANLFTYSDDAATAWSIKSGLTVSANTDIAPDGNQTMDTLVEDAAITDKYLERQITVNANQNITWSCYVKPLRRTAIFLVIYDGASYSNNVQFRYEFSNQTLSFSGAFGTGTFGSYSVVYVGNGVYRMVVSGQPTTSASTSVNIRIGFVNQSTTYLGTGAFAGAVWGAQLEAGAFPTSYIPTTASTVTRSVDNVEMTGTNFSSWYNSSEGTLFVIASPSTNAAYTGWIYLLGTDFNNGISYYRQSDYQPVIRIKSAVRDEYNKVFGAVGFGAIWRDATSRKSAFAFKTNDFNSCVSGFFQNISRATSGTLPTFTGPLYLGGLNDGSQKLNGTISRLTYYPKALKPNQLQLLTA